MHTDDVLSHFGMLDELIQVIYQGFNRFVVLSTVGESSWSVYVGLKGPEGRWWRGSWSARDVTQFIGNRTDSQVLESFAHNVSEAFVNGELSIGGWNTSDPDQGVKINLTFGPTSRKPVQIPLVELSAKDAASHAATVFSAIAVEAQSRKCRLNPPTFSASIASGPSRIASGSTSVSGLSDGVANTSATKPSIAHLLKVSHIHSPKKEHPVAPVQVHAEVETDAAKRKIKSLEAELAQVKAVKKGKSKSPSSESEPKKSTAVHRPKGASLANPHKKARRYQEVEFGSDDD